MAEFADDGATLFLALYVPGADPKLVDPEDIADVLAGIINEERVRNGGADTAGFDSPEVKPIEVSAIPGPQWCTAESLANLRAAARGVVAGPQATPGQKEP